MSNFTELKFLIICIVIANILASIIYFLKNNVPGTFNCFCWAGISYYIFANIENLLKPTDEENL